MQFRHLVFTCAVATVLFYYWLGSRNSSTFSREQLSISDSNDPKPLFPAVDSNNHSNSNLDDKFPVNLEIMNAMGSHWTTLKTLEESVSIAGGNLTILERMRSNYHDIQLRAPHTPQRLSHRKNPGPVINVAGVSCGPRRREFLAMVKSAIMFSQDANLHVIVFSDRGSILDLSQDLLQLKWTVNAIGLDFTYELHLDWFPPDSGGISWRKMYRPCATQRLFFPSLLPHIDALIYLDSDIIVVSNLTDLWAHFAHSMKDKKLAAMSANNEETAKGWYNIMSQIPYYGTKGLNAGVMLMNLTQMRAFDFQNRAIAAQTIYREKIALADQDIVNIIFHTFPEKVLRLDCSFNFNWIYCGIPGMYECNRDPTKGYCFCNSTLTRGVQIVHGNSGTFDHQFYPFLMQIHRAFRRFDFLTESLPGLVAQLKKNFDTLTNPCEPLTAEALYKNAELYSRSLFGRM